MGGSCADSCADDSQPVFVVHPRTWLCSGGARRREIKSIRKKANQLLSAAKEVNEAFKGVKHEV